MRYEPLVVISLCDIPAREVIVGDEVAGRYGEPLASLSSAFVNTVCRVGSENDRVNIYGESWCVGLGVDDIVRVRRRVTFNRDDLVSLINDASSSAGVCGENLSGEWVVSLLEGKRVES